MHELNLRIERIELKDWLAAAKQFNDYNYTHYWAYSNIAAKRIGACSEHISVVDEQGNLIALSNIRIKKLPFGLGGIAYISGGPMVDRGQKDFKKEFRSVLAVIRKEYVTKRGLVLRISQRHKVSPFCVQEASVYFEDGFSSHKKTNATMILDLSFNLDIIRKNFHQKWRNILNKSERQDIKIVAGNDKKLFVEFAGLFKELIAKKSFYVDMDDQFFMAVQEQSLEQEKFYIAIAYYDKKPIGGHLSSMGGDTSVYLLGAANEVGRKLGAAYLLQWFVINESIRKGCHWYDLGGIDQKENPNVYSFKKRMGGEETGIGHVFQVYEGYKGLITLWLENIYRILKSWVDLYRK